MIHRVTQPDGSLCLSTDSCRYTFLRLRPGTMRMTITGKETGELGRAPLGEVAAEAALHPPLRLFVDMSGLSYVADPVSSDWTAWFQANQHAVQRVHVLAPEVFVRLVVAVSQVFSRTGNLIRIHTEPARFDAALLESASVFAGDTPHVLSAQPLTGLPGR